MATMKIKVDRRGGVVVEGENFTGQACTLASKAIIDGLNGGKAEERLKEDYYQDAHEHLHEQN